MEMLPFNYWQSDPSGGQDAPKMTVGKESYISLEGTEMSDYPIGSVRNFGRHFTTRTSVTEQVPIRSRSTNFHGTLSFIFAVVPLGQIPLYFPRLNQRSQGASLPCTLPWAGEHPGEGSSAETFSQLAGVLFASFSQWKVSAAGMPT
jgi:hypothetical protein